MPQKEMAMTTSPRSNVRPGVSTQMHIAMPPISGARPPAYGVHFGLAAVVLSLLGVAPTCDVEQDHNATEVPFAAGE
jgi:hypothetical protein